MRSVTMTLPYPLSANRYWRTYMPKGFKAPVTVVSAEAKAYKAQVCGLARIAGVKAPIAGRVAIDVRLYPNRPQDWAKLDNANKVLFDALKGVVIEDDRWVRRITSERMEPDGEARVEVTITAIHPEPVQGGLL